MKLSKILYSKTFAYVPPIIIAIILCFINKTFIYLFLYFPIQFIWLLITLPLIKLEDHLIAKEYFNQQQKYLNKEVMDYFYLSEDEWKNQSQEKRNIIVNFYFTYIRNQRLHYEVSSQIPKDWKNFTIDDKMSIMKEYYELNVFYSNHLEKQKLVKDQKEKQEKEEKRRKEELKRNKELDEERIRAEKQKAKEDEERQIKHWQLEKQQQFEKQQFLHKKKIEEEERLKNKYKADLLKKENEKRLYSDAVKELIEDGLLDENYTNVFERYPIPDYVKNAVWKRDKECCVYCHSNINLEFDHIIPISKGGSNTIKNLQLLCRTCNRKKSNRI